MNDETLSLTANIVSSMIANNSVDASELPDLIASVHAALVRTSEPVELGTTEKPVCATTARKSLANSEHIVSMIDGKPYKSLKRHIASHGYTVESYKEAFGLPASYPMVAEAYSKARREISLKLGLGRKRVAAVVETIDNAAEQAVAAARKPVKKLGIVAAKAAASAHLTGEAPV